MYLDRHWYIDLEFCFFALSDYLEQKNICNQVEQFGEIVVALPNRKCPWRSQKLLEDLAFLMISKQWGSFREALISAMEASIFEASAFSWMIRMS